MFIRFLLLSSSFGKEEFCFGKLLYPAVYILAFSIENIYFKHILLYYCYQQYLKLLNLR